jgi:hypothetical protein
MKKLEITMKKLMSGVLTVTLAATLSVATVVPLSAAPVVVPSQSTANDVQTVQHKQWRKMERHNGRFYREGNARYHNGHRGYRERRRGYREHNGFWFPAGAFIAGALITGAIDNAPRSGNAHVQWCYDHYRSYRAYDNTYQPYSGPRREC